MSEIKFNTFEQIRTHIFEHGFDGPPGKSEYTNLPAYVLGVLLERIGQNQLEVLGRRYFFAEIGMEYTTYFPALQDCPPTEIVAGNEIQGFPHDESARVFALARRSVGQAGLFSNAPDLLSFSEALFEGRFPGLAESAEAGLGWSVNQNWFMGTHVSEKAFGKTGFTGTSIVIDRKKKTSLIILSNRTYPTRPADATSLTSAINLFRRDIADIVFG